MAYLCRYPDEPSKEVMVRLAVLRSDCTMATIIAFNRRCLRRFIPQTRYTHKKARLAKRPSGLNLRGDRTRASLHDRHWLRCF
jgi:hypothetical protein